MEDTRDIVITTPTVEAETGGRLLVFKLPMTASTVDYHRAAEIASHAAEALATQGVVTSVVIPMNWEVFLLPMPAPVPTTDDLDTTVALDEEETR